MVRKKTALRGISASVRETKVAIYIRVSTIHQVDKDSIPMQKKDLIAYCQLILGTDNYEIFEDAGYSGKNTDRPAFQDMMKKIPADPGNENRIRGDFFGTRNGSLFVPRGYFQYIRLPFCGRFRLEWF